MAQRRYWNYQDDDSTFDFIQWQLGIHSPGRFRGFDPVLAAGMNLTLNHATSGADKVALDGLTITRHGIWYSKQGTVVTETADIVLPIANGDATFPRIDLIVGQHKYVAVLGGAVATYLVIQGTPAANPTAPALTPGFEPQQVILGQIYIPANTTNLNDAGVVYTQAAVPDYANDGTIAHTDRTNNFEELQIVKGLQEYSGQATLDTAGLASVIFLKDSTGANNDNERDVYFLVTTSVPSNDYRVTAFSNLPTPPSGQVRRFTLVSASVSLRFDGATFGRNYFLKAGGAVTIVVDSAGNKYFEEADEASLGRVNRFYRTQIHAVSASVGSIVGGLLALNGGDGNIFALGNDGTNNLIRGIQSTQAFDQGPDANPRGGGIIWLLPNPNFTLRIQNSDFTVPVGYKPIFSPTVVPFDYYRGGDPMMLVETAFFWYLAKGNNMFYDIPINLTHSGAGSFVLNGGTSGLKVRISENSVTVRCVLNVNITGNISYFVLDLNLPYNFPGLIQVVPGSLGAGLSRQTVFVQTATGSQVWIYMPNGANFPAGNGQNIHFTQTFQLIE